MSQNIYHEYFQGLDLQTDKMRDGKQHYMEKPNKQNSILFRKQLLELKKHLGQARKDVLALNKSRTKKPDDVNTVETETPKVENELLKETQQVQE